LQPEPASIDSFWQRDHRQNPNAMILISMSNFRTNQRKMMFHVIFCCAAALSFLSLCERGHAQGAATGGKAVPAKPLPPGMKAPTVQYQDIAAQAGLVGVNVSGAEHGKQYIVETTGTGVAIFDYDNDGLPDIFFVNAGRLQDAGETTHFLYHNLGNLKFEDVTKKAGIAHTGWGQGVCVGDVDNDGHPDLFITQWGRNVLYRNQGNGTFQDETKARGLLQSTPRWSTGCAFLDFNRDGYLDLMVVHYVDFDLAQTPRPGDNSQCIWKGIPVMCGPRGLPGETVSLYQNDGHGRFADVSDELHITGPKNYYGFTALTGDFDNDGWPDVYVACDSTANLYYHNVGGKKFEQIALSAGIAYNEDGREQAGMGVTAADFNGDGKPDIALPGYFSPSIRIFFNNGSGGFGQQIADIPYSSQGQSLFNRTLFAVDVNHDGNVDMLVSSPNSKGVQVLLGNGSGGFSQLPQINPSTNLALISVADVNNDLMPDLIFGGYNYCRNRRHKRFHQHRSRRLRDDKIARWNPCRRNCLKLRPYPQKC